jgi:hypothetical protein
VGANPFGEAGYAGAGPEWARKNTARVNEARQKFDAACPEGRNGSHF